MFVWRGQFLLHVLHQGVESGRILRVARAILKRALDLAGAAIGVGRDMMERAEALVKAKVDVVVLDSAHGHSAGSYTPHPETPHPEFPMTLDLRRPPGL